MPFATTSRGKLYYEARGTGAVVLLVHGLSGDLSAWTSQIDSLSSSFRVIAFDNRGAGRSDQIAGPETTGALAGDALELLDLLEVDHAQIVGRSMGGAIAQHMALMAPERVRSLVLCGSFARLDALGLRILANLREVLEWRGSWQDLARHAVVHYLAPDFYLGSPEAVAEIERLIGGSSRLHACYIAQSRACEEHDTLADLERIRCPTLVMSGGRDPICSPLSTSWMLDRLPHAESVVFEGSSHFFLLEEAERSSKVLADWLGRHALSDPVDRC